MSNEVLERSDAPFERPSATTDPSGRDWGAIGVGLVAAFAVIALYVVVIWAIAILVQALV